MAMNAQAFLEALEELESQRGINKEEVLEALKEAMIKGYKKQLGGEDADVRVTIDLEKGTIDLYEVKVVRDEVEDDFLEISTEEANRLDPSRKYQDGDEFIIHAPIDEVRKATAMKIKSVLKQKFSEKEKAVLYDAYKDKIGTIITGRVERVEDRGVSVNIGKASAYLPRNNMIGNETFNIGDSIKVYVSDVTGDFKGAKIVISRSNEGFLRCLFTDADGIHDIYDGTIIIKAIARRAGERSKVAVYSNDPNVDPAAACIGHNGANIQKIVAQLGNGAIKEKIDIITYSDIPALYIMESIKPAKAIGVEVDEENKEASIVVDDDALSVAVGKRGVNINLASKLTGYKLNIVTASEADEYQIEYVTYDQAQLEAVEKRAQLIRESELASEEALPGAPEGYVAPQERVYADEENTELDAALAESVEKEEVEATPKKEEPKEEKAEEKVEEKAKEETKTTEVKTTTTIADLEKALEEDKNKKNTQNKKKSTRKKKDETEEEDNNDSPVIKTDSSTHMAIYTEEELREFEEEEAKEEEYDEDDVDYDDYDEYYDDDDR